MANRTAEVVGKRERNEALSVLIDEGGSTTLEELVEKLRCSRHNRKSLKIEFHHNCLPRLQDMGVLTYDWQSREIELIENPQFLRRLLETAAKENKPVAVM